jgi:hypothetical protein
MGDAGMDKGSKNENQNKNWHFADGHFSFPFSVQRNSNMFLLCGYAQDWQKSRIRNHSQCFGDGSKVCFRPIIQILIIALSFKADNSSSLVNITG